MTTTAATELDGGRASRRRPSRRPPAHRSGQPRRRRAAHQGRLGLADPPLIYTSGTTGPPKGVQLAHRNLIAAVQGIEALVQFPPDDELTPTMKIKRKPIAAKYEREIEALYAE